MTKEVKEEKLKELMNRISLALKDTTLQQGFEIICKKLAELEKENEQLKEKIKMSENTCDTWQEIQKADNELLRELEKENAELQEFAENIVKASADNPNEFFELKKENEILKNSIEQAIKNHYLFNKNEIVNFTAKCVWEALNPKSTMCVPNAMYIKIEQLLEEYLKGKK